MAYEAVYVIIGAIIALVGSIIGSYLALRWEYRHRANETFINKKMEVFERYMECIFLFISGARTARKLLNQWERIKDDERKVAELIAMANRWSKQLFFETEQNSRKYQEILSLYVADEKITQKMLILHGKSREYADVYNNYLVHLIEKRELPEIEPEEKYNVIKRDISKLRKEVSALFRKEIKNPVKR